MSALLDVFFPIFYVLVITPLALYGWHCLHRDHVGPWIERHTASLLFRILRRFL